MAIERKIISAIDCNSLRVLGVSAHNDKQNGPTYRTRSEGYRAVNDAAMTLCFDAVMDNDDEILPDAVDNKE